MSDAIATLEAAQLASPNSATASTCPDWCENHLAAGDVVHRGEVTDVAGVAVAVERFDAENAPYTAVPAVNITSSDRNLTAAETRQLAGHLNRLADTLDSSAAKPYTSPTLPAGLNVLDASRCSSWCIMHSPSDSGLIHYSDIAEVVPTAGGAAEHRPIEVTLEQMQRTAGGPLDPASVVLNHNGYWVDPMTADEALHLAGLLILTARRAASR